MGVEVDELGEVAVLCPSELRGRTNASNEGGVARDQPASFVLTPIKSSAILPTCCEALCRDGAALFLSSERGVAYQQLEVVTAAAGFSLKTTYTLAVARRSGKYTDRSNDENT